MAEGFMQWWGRHAIVGSVYYSGSSLSHTVVCARDNYNGVMEGNVLFNNTLNTFLFMVIWHWTYGKGPFK